MSSFKKVDIVDLSREFSSPPTWPGMDDIEYKRIICHSLHGVQVTEIKTTLHSSTHMDAPFHYISHGASIDEIPIENFVGEGVILNIQKEALGMITEEDFEKVSPVIEPDDIVIIHTGWHHLDAHKDESKFMLLFPGLVESAAEWLKKKKVKMVGIDTPCIDHPFHTDLPEIRPELFPDDIKKEEFPVGLVHRHLLGAGIPIIEMVGGNIDNILDERVFISSLPLKIPKGDGSPVRLVAFRLGCNSR